MRRRLLASVGGKPLPYLRRVAYLESNEQQYIETGIYADNTTKVRCNVAFTKLLNDNAIVSVDSGNYLTKSFTVEQTNSYGITMAYHAVNSNEIPRGPNAVIGEEYAIEAYGGKIKVDGVEYGVGIETEFVSDYQLCLFCYYRNGRPIIYSALKLLSLEIEKNGVMERKFIPVLDFSGRPAMYDKVSGQFFYNQGTGEFTWGELET